MTKLTSFVYNSLRFSSLQLQVNTRMATPSTSNGSSTCKRFCSTNRPACSTTSSELPSSSVSLPPNKVFLQVIENGSSGYGKSIFMFTDNNRYLFNCPENVSRLIGIIPNFRSRCLQDVFLTRKDWDIIGGLPGLGLNLKGAGNKKLRMHGPGGLDMIFKATNCIYDGQPPVELELRHFSEKFYEDEAIKIFYVPLASEISTQAALAEHHNLQALNSRYYSPNVINNSQEPDIDPCQKFSVAYICHVKQRPGRMNAVECFKRGIPFGPLIGQLQKGQTVTLANGCVIKPEEVMNPPEPAVVFAVVDVGDEYVLKSLLETKEFDEYFSSGEEKSKCDLIVHMTDQKIFESTDYQRWMCRFGSKIQHLIINESCPAYCHNKGIYKLQAQLNHLDSDIFPLLRCNAQDYDPKTADFNSSIIKAEPFMCYHIRPHNKFVRDVEFNAALSIKDCVDAMLLTAPNDNLTTELERYQVEKTNYLANIESEPENFPEVIFLGTSSASTTKYRGVSSILVNLSEYRSMLLDCGEGSYHQLVQYYANDEKLDKILTNIKVIFISHLHADHHGGLFTLFVKRKEAFDRLNLNFEPVFIIGPSELMKIQHMYSRYVHDVMPLAKRICSNADDALAHSQFIAVRRRLGLKSLLLCKVNHPKAAFGIIFRTMNGYKIVYSGDTSPSVKLIGEGVDADLLIHEATFDDTRIDDAKMKFHSTISQAYEVAQKMRAKYSIFTHFSCRYSHVPLFTDRMLSNNNVAFAMDFMKFTPALGKRASCIMPLLRSAFAEEYADSLTKRDMYEMRLKRQYDERIRQMKVDQHRIMSATN